MYVCVYICVCVCVDNTTHWCETRCFTTRQRFIVIFCMGLKLFSSLDFDLNVKLKCETLESGS